MNLKHILLITLCFISLPSCNKNNKDQNETSKSTTKQEKNANKLIFDIDLKTSEPDDFSLFLRDVFLNNSQFMNISIKNILNSNETEKILHFEFPENIKPERQMFLTLGTRIEKEVQINKITISYGDLNYTILPEDLMDYFTMNKYVDYNSETNTFTTKKIDNQLNPIIFFRQKIVNSFQDAD